MKDYILAEIWRVKTEEGQFKSLTHYSTYNHEKEAEMLRNYPVVWTINQDHDVTKLASNEQSTDSCTDGTCTKDSKKEKKSKKKNRSDEL